MVDSMAEKVVVGYGELTESSNFFIFSMEGLTLLLSFGFWESLPLMVSYKGASFCRWDSRVS